jgi:glycosyltransferase involved in cell wall biosynthesis
MSLATPAPETTATATTAPVLDVVVPVYNEENDLAPCVRKLHAHLTQRFPHSFRITIADNASTDGTAEIADALADELSEVRAVHLAEKGRGRALKAVWSHREISRNDDHAAAFRAVLANRLHSTYLRSCKAMVQVSSVERGLSMPVFPRFARMYGQSGSRGIFGRGAGAALIYAG